ncbi:MAG: hypothetical protein M3273_09115 [Actinomycetota bacterium]|nr:hypothetical protein [Actinomycetota bacterium]
MARVNLTCVEKAQIETIAAELDTSIDEFFGDLRAELSCEQWDVLTRYASACVRRALEVGVLLHAVVDAEPGRIAYSGRGRMTFVRQALAAWKDAFAPVADVWRIATVFATVPGGEQRVLADVSTLEVMAANRMFVTLDDQCAAMLEAGGA